MVEPGLIVVVRDIDDQGVAFPAPTRSPIQSSMSVREMRPGVEGNHAVVMAVTRIGSPRARGLKNLEAGLEIDAWRPSRNPAHRDPDPRAWRRLEVLGRGGLRHFSWPTADMGSCRRRVDDWPPGRGRWPVIAYVLGPIGFGSSRLYVVMLLPGPTSPGWSVGPSSAKSGSSFGGARIDQPPTADSSGAAPAPRSPRPSVATDRGHPDADSRPRC